MSKGEIGLTVTKNQKKLLVIFFAIISIFAISNINVYASTNDYVVEVKDDGSQNIAQDDKSSITKTIVADDAKSLTYEVKVNNLADTSKVAEIAIVIDSSKSMSINDMNNDAKTKAIELVTALLKDAPKAKVSISTNMGVKVAMSNSALSTYTTAINNVTYTDSTTLEKGIDYATSTLSSTNTEKYLVIFSDATDSIQTKIVNATKNDVTVYSILTDMTNKEYVEADGQLGQVDMISDIKDFSYIYNRVTKSILNVKVTDIFSEEVVKYFDFTIESKDSDVEVEETSQGYILKCGAIKGGESKTFKYKLTLKNNAKIDAGKIYRDFNSSDNINIEYENLEGDSFSYEMNNSPTLVICKKYSLTIKAVSEESNKVVVEGIDVKIVGTIVTGTDEHGNDITKVVYEDTLTTDSKGKIVIDELKTLGDITFEISPIVNKFGYSATDSTTVIVHNDPTGVGAIWAESDDLNVEEDAVNRNITVELPINVETYKMVIETTDLNNSNIKISDVQYRLIQPKLNSKYDMDVLYGTTDEDGRLVFNPTVMTTDGSYQYILSQMNELEDYDSMGNVTLVVTFENGKVTKISSVFNTNVKAGIELEDEETISKVNVGLLCTNDDTFRLELNLTDEDTKEKLSGATYNFTLTRQTSGGTTTTFSYNGYRTDSNGQILLDLPGSGYVSLTITEVSPKAGYISDKTTKTIVINRQNGTVQNVLTAPTDIVATADTDNNKLKVEMTSKTALEQNRIQVHLFDNTDPASNVAKAMISITKQGSTNFTQGYTDLDGIANFILENETAGVYYYDISLVGGAPSGYIMDYPNLATIEVTFTQNSNGQTYITAAKIINYTTESAQAIFSQDTDSATSYIYDTAKVDLGIKPDPSNSYEFKIKLLDGTNSNFDITPILEVGLEGAKYSITIYSDGEEVKYLSNKLTDKNGEYTTKIVGGGKIITIEVQETQTIAGYVLTKDKQTIELEWNDATGYTFTKNGSSVNEYDEANSIYNGVEQKGSTIIYHDVNNGKTGANTVLNLYVNKMDTNDFLVAGVKVQLSSPTLLDENEQKLDTTYTLEDEEGNIVAERTEDFFRTDENGFFEVLGIKVDGENLTNGERIDYLYINELDSDGNVINNTNITLKLTFRKNKETNAIEVTNVETTWGNRLIKSRTYSSRETDIAYESDVYLDLYTNFDDVGNFSIDLKKVDKDGNELAGAEYNVVLTRPNGTTFVRTSLPVTSNVELEGLYVTEGTTIEITEVKAPIGYNVNEYTELITITNVDSTTGLVSYKLDSSGYTPARSYISNDETITTSDGVYKKYVTLDLVDYEMDTFKFGITTLDSTTLNPVSGYNYIMTSSQGAYKITDVTNKDGEVSTLIGANYKIENYEVTYTISTKKAADYYKDLSTPIEVKVIFGLNGEVKATDTLLANKNQPGYETVWKIIATNTIDGNDIDIQINMDPSDPLKVNIETVDTITNTKITTAEYSITPTINIPATGSTKVDVGYVLPNGLVTYTIKQTNASDMPEYEPIENQQIRVSYNADGNVTDVIEVSNEVHLININEKEITIQIDIEPSVPFTISNIAYFNNTQVLANGKFKVTTEKSLNIGNVVTDINGEDEVYVGKFEENSSVIYTIEQTDAEYGFATVEKFQIEVFFDENRNISDVQILGDVNKYVTFITATYTVPSTKSDRGYNNNPNGIVNLTIANYPDVEFIIENVDRQDETIKLSGTNYKIESSINTKDEHIITNENGIGTAYLDRSGYSQTVTYTITELNSASRYQTLAIPAQIEVDFSNEGYIINTPRVIVRNDVVTAQIPEEYSTTEDNFKLYITIKNNPELTINLTKVDSEDSTITIPKVDFEITARIVRDNLTEFTDEQINDLTLNTNTLTNEEYLLQVLDRLKINEEDIEKIKQDIALEKLISDLKVDGNLTDEEEDEYNKQANNTLKISYLVNLNKATKTQINDRINNTTNQNVIDVLIENGTTTKDRVDELLKTVKGLVRLDVDNITTDSKGNAIAYLDKTLANKTVEYTIKETKKADGYDWLDEVVIIEISYDSTGKMEDSNPVKVVSGDIEIVNVDQANFKVDVQIKNIESQDFKIHLVVEDVYDSNKKLETATFDAYLVDTTSSVSFSPDADYRVTLSSGSVTTTTGLITAHGEDTESMGIYDKGEGNRILRLVQKSTPTSYYIENTKYDSLYQAISYALVFNVSFDDEGKITGASRYNPGGYSNDIGIIADERYTEVSYTNRTLNITIKYYPMLQVQIQAVDMYTNESLEGKYTIDTRMWNTGSTSSSAYVSSGYQNPHWTRPIYSTGYEYWGRTYNASYTTSTSISSLDEANRTAISPIEADAWSQNKRPDTETYDRVFYIYENAEPNSPIQYQTYLPRYITTSSQYILAEVYVTYTANGEVENVTVKQAYSSNNITSGFITTVKATANAHTIQIQVKYAPITTINATVIDEVSGVGLSGIRINPYLDGNYSTRTSYEYRTILSYTTGNAGTTGWTYWGTSLPNSLNRYVLDTYTTGSGYDGYFDPQNIILDVSYDEYGRISAVTPKSTDQFGDVNAIDITWENNNINVTIKYCRKFNVELFKVDYDDSNKKLSAVFDIQSSEGTNVTMSGNTTKTIGKIYAGKTVKYTLSETTVPTGYLPVSNLEMLVTFKNDGSILSATSTSEYFEFIKSAPTDATTNSLNKIDLIANIKNKTRFDVSIELSDEFYPSVKLEGGIFTIENDLGDVSSGGVQTDANGIMQTYVGSPYANQKVTYTVKQTGTVSGYYTNNTIVKFVVEYNENGKIQNYSVIDGKDICTVDPTKYIGTKELKLNITNMPKDIRIGVNKFDKVTNEAIALVDFNVTVSEEGKVDQTGKTTTNPDGTFIYVADEFEKTNANKTVRYTISEIKAPDSYRKVQDVVIDVTYKPDGSIYLYNVVSNESNLGVEVATNKTIYYINEIPVHIKLTVPNDNAYDVIIKDEDTNFAGLGIEGTKYDISITADTTTDVVEQIITTDENGIAKLADQQQTGHITISIAENTIGEGYREDNNNYTVIEVEKGKVEYSLSYGTHTNTTYADVVVDEGHGTITVTFKNETKLELTLQKEDINTNDVLENAEFEIVQRELDNFGNAIDGTEKTITTDGNNITNIDGLLYFDLGLAYQNKTIEYEFTETVAPAGYDLIFPIKVKVVFDQYGRITSITNDSFRAESILETNTGKSHNMIVIIGNGTLNQVYTVKIVTEDSYSNARINDSVFEVEIVEHKKDTSTGIITSGINTSLMGSTKKVTSNVAGKSVLLENGALKVGTTAEGEVDINFTQVETAFGYTIGSNQTSGTVKIQADFAIGAEDLTKDVTLSVIDDNGFDVTIDNTNKIVLIKIKNDSQTVFEITKLDSKTNEPIENAKFNVTSEIVLSSGETTTVAEEELALTDTNGYTESNKGIAYSGKKVIYTLTEEKMADYQQLDDVVILVQYNSNGNIASYKILSSQDYVTINEEPEERITIKKVPRYDSEKNGYILVDNNISYTPGIGSKVLELTIYNDEIPNDYQIVISKANEDATYTDLIPGATYRVTVNQESGKESTSWIAVTDENGTITSPYFDGYGLIEVEITEISAPEGYQLDSLTKTIKFTRNKRTQKMILQSADAQTTFNSDYTIVNVMVTSKTLADTYTILINKVDSTTGSLIAENPATIKLEMEEVYETINTKVDTDTGEITEEVTQTTLRTPITEEETDEDGRIVLKGLTVPEKEGTYTYVLSETSAPEGYTAISESEVKILVTFEENIDGAMVITNVKVENAVDVKAIRNSDQLMSIMVYNENGVELTSDEYGFEIRKVDSDLVVITGSTTELTLTNTLTGEVETITIDELGRTDLVKFKIPSEAGVYKYILNETVAPQGYKLLTGDMEIFVEFLEDTNGKIYLNSVTTRSGNLVYANAPAEGELPNRKIQLKVINDDVPYTIVIEKHHELDPDYPYFIPNVTFDIVVTEEFATLEDGTVGKKVSTYRETTNSDGIITLENFTGYGRILVEITEVSAPVEYKADYTTKHLEFYRAKSDKSLNEYDADVNYVLNEDEQIITLQPVNELAGSLYAIVINKLDKEDNALITDNPTKFNLYMIKDYYNYVDVTDPITGEVTKEEVLTKLKEKVIDGEYTDREGMIVKDNAVMPTEAGTYTFELEEVTSPTGYSPLSNTAELEITFDYNNEGKFVITNVVVTKESDNVKVITIKEKLITIAVYNEIKVLDGKVQLDITKVDTDDNAILTDTALFKLTNNLTSDVLYAETSTDDAMASIVFEMPETAGTYEYTLNEIKAPNGYKLNRDNIQLKVTYAEKIDTKEIYISDVEVIGDNVNYLIPSTGVSEDKITLKVINEEGESTVNTKPYTLIINKIDSVTNKKILDRATFEVSLVNGEVVYAATNTNGQIIIENVYMPANSGDYQIVIKELTAPEGYKLDKEMKIVNATFTGTGDNMVISNESLETEYNKNIEIVYEECTEDTIVLNILNEVDDLYVISKKDENEDDIYDVMKSFTGKHYSIDTPFIDTRVAKAGKNMTVQEFIDNLESNGVMTIWDSQGNQLSSTDTVKTGMTLKATKEDRELTFTIVVKGDADGDGRVRAKDLDILVKHLSEEVLLTDPIKLRALDMHLGGDGKIRATDLNEFYNVLSI